MVPHEYVTAKELSGTGYEPEVITARSSDLEICAVSHTRAESRALEEYPPIERNPIVPRIASIVITTISSINVNQLNFAMTEGFFILAIRDAMKIKIPIMVHNIVYVTVIKENEPGNGNINGVKQKEFRIGILFTYKKLFKPSTTCPRTTPPSQKSRPSASSPRQSPRLSTPGQENKK